MPFGRHIALSKGPKRGKTSGPGRGRRLDERMEDRPPRLMNRAVGAAKKEDTAKAKEYASAGRLTRRLGRHLAKHSKDALGPEHAKVARTNRTGKHRV